MSDERTTFPDIAPPGGMAPRDSEAATRVLHPSGARDGGTPSAGALASAPVDLRRKYRILAKLGDGGTGYVHLAIARGTAGVRKLVVLKSIRSELSHEPAIREMFLDEARLAATLSHPNVVQTFEVFLSERSLPVLVMEYLDGQPLSKIARASAPPEQLLRLNLHALCEVLRGLQYVHGVCDLNGTPLDLVHRDMSPHNVFITYEGQVKILDFGIAKVTGASGNTRTGVLKGKVRYMAPEQLLAARAVDNRADLFAVGVMLWEAITAQRFWGAMDDVQIIRRLTTRSIPPPSVVAPETPQALERVCMKALAHDRDRRYASAAEMEADLEAAIAELGLSMGRRELRQTLCDMFAECRSATNEEIERRLREDETAGGDVPSIEGDFLSDPAEQDPSGVGDQPTVVHGPGAPAPRRRRLAPIVALLALSAIGAVSWFAAHPHRQPDTARAPTSDTGSGGAASAAVASVTPPTAAPPSSAAANPELVSVDVRATPATAKLFFDDVPLGSNPFQGSLPRDSRQHSIRAVAPGYRSMTRTVELSGSLTVGLTLERIAAAAPRSNNVGALPGPAPKGQSESVSCTPPFYVDAEGVKRVKEGCFD